MGKNDFYSTATPGTSFYSSAVTGGSEANMREEFNNTMDGSWPEVAKAQPGLLRRMRRDSDGKLIACECVDPVTKEPDKDRYCPICMGEGFYWDEEELEYYSVIEDSDVDNAQRDTLKGPGLINVPIVVFYIRYDSNITRDDKIVKLILGTDGTADTPRKRRDIYRVNTAWDYRADNGKLEYWKVYTYREQVKHLNSPDYGDI